MASILFATAGTIGEIGNIYSKDNLLKMDFEENDNDISSRKTLTSDIRSLNNFIDEITYMNNSICINTYGDYDNRRSIPLKDFTGYEKIVNEMRYANTDNVEMYWCDLHSYGSGRINVVVKDRKVAFFNKKDDQYYGNYSSIDLIIFDSSSGKGYVVENAGENTIIKETATIVHEIDESISPSNLKVYAMINLYERKFQCIMPVKTDGNLTLEPDLKHPPIINLLTEAAYRRMGLSKSQMGGINNAESLIAALEANSTSCKKREKVYVYNTFKNYNNADFSGMYETTDNIQLYYLNETTKPYISIEYGTKEMIQGAWGGMPIIYFGAEPKPNAPGSRNHALNHYVIVVKDDGMGYIFKNKYINHSVNSDMTGDKSLIRGAYVIKDPQIYNNMDKYKTFISFTEIDEVAIPNNKSIFVVKERPTTP